jgi:hypothetical protein
MVLLCRRLENGLLIEYHLYDRGVDEEPRATEVPQFLTTAEMPRCGVTAAIAAKSLLEKQIYISNRRRRKEGASGWQGLNPRRPPDEESRVCCLVCVWTSDSHRSDSQNFNHQATPRKRPSSSPHREGAAPPLPWRVVTKAATLEGLDSD